jgi:hypothetical protein
MLAAEKPTVVVDPPGMGQDIPRILGTGIGLPNYRHPYRLVQDHSAQHYLRIYRLKLRMAEDGTTRPSAAGLAFLRRLVAALEALELNAPVRLETTQEVALFTDARTGLLLAEVQIGGDVLPRDSSCP